jgi:hypothetical protein
LAAVVLGAALTLAPADPFDFAMFWYAGGHPAEAYAVDLVHSPAFVRATHMANSMTLPFFYPPPLLLLFFPLGFLPLAAAKAIWSGGWCGAFVWVASRDTRWATPLFAISIPLLWGTAIGQTGAMIATLIVAAATRLDERPRLAGALLALAACKPQAVLLVPILLWGRWTAVRAALVTGVGLMAASLLLGPQRWVEWFHLLPRFADLVQPAYPKITPAFLFHATGWKVVVAAVGVCFALAERNVRGLLVGTLMVSPYVQLYDLAGISYLGATLVADARRSSAATVVFGVALVICAAWPILTTAYCAGLILIWAIRRYRRGRDAPPAPEWHSAAAAESGLQD